MSEEHAPTKTLWSRTLPAIMVGVAIILVSGAIMGVVLPVLTQARDYGVERVRCRSNLRMIGLALTQYVDECGANRYLPFPKGRPGVPDDYTGKHFLAMIWWSGIISEPGILLCPSSRDDNNRGADLGPRDGQYGENCVGGICYYEDTPPGVPESRWLPNDTSNHHFISYASKGWKVSYLPGSTIRSVLTDNLPRDTVIACDDTAGKRNHREGFNALFADLHVEWISGPQFDVTEKNGSVMRTPPLDMVCN